MAITTYSELQDAIKSWLNKENAEITARIPDFIAFGENAIFRELRTRYNEASQTYQASVGDNSASVTLPPRYKETKALLYGDKLLQRKTDQWYNSQDKTRGPGQPLYFARIGNELRFWPQADENADVALTYYEQQPNISTQTTPNLFVEFPELYLFSALIEAFPFLQNQDPSQLAVWQGKYTQVIGQIDYESWREENSGSTNTVSSAYNELDARTHNNRGYY